VLGAVGHWQWEHTMCHHIDVETPMTIVRTKGCSRQQQ
jgi:hypothetical protein